MSKIAVVGGGGKLGSCLAAVLANVGHDVRVIDPFNISAVEAINAKKAPVPELGLDTLIQSLPDGRLSAWETYTFIQDCEATFVVVPTPSMTDGRFSSAMVVDAADQVGKYADPGHTFIVCSTVMPGAINSEVIPALNRDDISVAYNPQFIALGSVIHDMHHPDVVLIGAQDARTHARVEGYLNGIHYSIPHIANLSIIDAEIAKITLNAMVVSKIAWANTIAEACEGIQGANASAVLNAIGHDKRIGIPYLRPGANAAGPCFPRDSLAMEKFLNGTGTPAYLSMAAQESNDHQIDRAMFKLRDYEKVGILGLSYKPDTPITDESLGMAVYKTLQAEGVEVIAHDPMAKPANVMVMDSPQDVIAVSDALLVATAWDEYKHLDVEGKFTWDPWGILDPQPGVRVAGRWRDLWG